MRIFFILTLLVVGCRTVAPTPATRGQKRLPPSQRQVAAQMVAVAGVDDDAEMAAFIAPYKKTVAAQGDRVIGELTGPLERGKPESTMGDFFVDAMRERTAEHVGTKLDFCFQNSGGLRRDLPAGPISVGLVVELMPFDNTVVVFEMSGVALRRLLDDITRRGDPFSGAKIFRQGRKMQRAIVAGAELNAGKTYRVCTNDYVYEGGGGYPLEDAKNVVYTGVLIRDMIIDYIENAKGPISPALDGRTVQVSE